MIDNRPVCLADSIVDHEFYANQLGLLAGLENSHLGARDTVAAFCAAHGELVKAAESGALDDEATAKQVVEAVKKSVPARPSQAAPTTATAPPAKADKTEPPKADKTP